MPETRRIPSWDKLIWLLRHLALILYALYFVFSLAADAAERKME